jgi:hypothetical protein
MTAHDEILIAQFLVKGTRSLLITSEAISRVIQAPPNVSIRPTAGFPH